MEERKKVGLDFEEEEFRVANKRPKKKGKIKFVKNMLKIKVSFILFFPVFKTWLEESGFLEDVKPKPVIGTPRGRSLSPMKRNAVKLIANLKIRKCSPS
jgi:hypothetical protein